MCEHCGCRSEREGSCGGACECHEHSGYFSRRFQTKAAQIAELEAYLTELKTEVQAVEEHLEDLRK